MSAPAKAPASYNHARALPELPEPGTRVVLQFRGAPRHGEVQPYDARWSHGTFPVRFDDGQWRLMAAADVTLERTR